MTYLKEEDVDEFKDFVAENVGMDLFGYDDFTLDKAEVGEYETEACVEEDGREDLYTSVAIDFAFITSGYDEDSWWSITKGCTKTFDEEDFEKFYERKAQ